MSILRALRRMPFTLSLAAVLVIVAVITGPLFGPSHFLRDIVGVDIDAFVHNEWWSFVTADFFVDNLGELIVVVLAALVGVGIAERLMGSWRAIVAFLVTGALGAAVGIGLQALGVFAGEYWANSVRSLVTVDPLTPIIGTVAVASAFASVLWRRRIRIVSLAATTVFLLFSGQPSDLYRLIAVLLGIAIGVVWTRQRIRPARWTSSHHETRVLFASVTVIFAIGPIVTLLSRGRFGLLAPLGSFVTDGMPRALAGATPCTVGGVVTACTDQLARHAFPGISAIVLAIVPLIILLCGAYGLLLGRRAAVYIVAGVATADGVLAAVYFGVVPASGQASVVAQRVSQAPEFAGWIIANAVIPVALAVLLVSQLRNFPVRARPRATRAVVLVSGAAFLASAGTYVGIGWLLRDQFRPTITVFDLLNTLLDRFVPTSFLLAQRRSFVPTTMASRALYHGVGPAFWIVLLIGVIVLLRQSRVTPGLPGEAAEVRRLLSAASGSMSFPATWAGNSYWFNDDRTLAVAYRVVNGCAVTTGEPFGAAADPRASLSDFIRFCDTNGWRPVFYGVHESWAQIIGDLGWSRTVIAEETIIDPETWQLTGKKSQDVRSSVNRAAREGIRAVWYSWPNLPAALARQIAEISELWVVERKLPELGFTLGGIEELRDPDVYIGLAIDSQWKVQAVTSWLPTWRDGVLVGYTLDFMRRRADGMNGAMEFLIAEAVVLAQIGGLEFVSLSGAPLAIAAADEEQNAIERLLDVVGRSLEPVYGFRSLLAFKKKFQPRLEPLYLCYPDALSLPAIAVAISRCYLPDLTIRESASLVLGLR